MLHALIMAGGSGTRFWPASRQQRPKQLLNLTGHRSMIQATADRLVGLVEPQNWIVLTNQALVDAIRKQLPQFPPESIIGEPFKRDTAPCVGLAAAMVAAKDPDGTMIVLPSDHIIQPTAAFQAAVAHAVSVVDANPEQIVTFGVKPTWAADSYGYIETHPSSANETGLQTRQVLRFHEKPNLETAQRYLESGSFHWNAGIFVWKASTVWDALQRFEPEMFEHLQKIAAALEEESFADTLATEFEAIQGKSIDFAIMERYEHISMIDAPFEWDDLGNWSSVPRCVGTDGTGNAITGEHLGIDTTHSIIRSESGHLLVTVGVDNLIIVQTENATLVADRSQEAKIKEVVAQLEQRGMVDYL